MRAIHLLTVCTATLIATGCASGTGGGAAGEASGSGSEWSSLGDGGAADPDDACFPDEHRCDGACVPDQRNEPSVGCERGCGDPCPVPEGATATCSLDGRCDFECEAPFERVGDGCECVPRTCGEECGEIEDGCGGTLDCGACSAGCEPDEAEENEVQAQAHELGEMTDRPRTDVVMDTYALHAQTDVDWYRATITDAFGDGNPTLEITLADAAPGYTVGAWFVCDSGGDDTACEAGTTDNSAGRGCVASTGGTAATTVKLQTSCSGLDESGVLVVRVMAETEIEACVPYTLGISVD